MGLLDRQIGAIDVGPIRYQVMEAARLTQGDRSLWGEIDYGAATIRVDPEVTRAYRRVLIWHEVLHAVLGHAGQKIDEETIQALAYGIVSLIDANRGNPLLWAGSEEENERA